MSQDVRSIPEYNFRFQDALIGAQMLFVAFGALVLVPILTGLDSNVALFAAGVATLIFQIITKGTVPIFLASSFAFIAPIMYGVQTWGIPQTLCGLIAVGFVYMALAALIRIKGRSIIDKVLPPIVTGPVIMVIGLTLSPVAIDMATGLKGVIPRDEALFVAMISLLTTILTSILGKGIIRLVPIFCGIITGYIAAYFFGMVNLNPIAKASWFAMPNFVFPEWNLSAVLYILPIAIVPAIEHVGDILAIGSVTGKKYIEKPGIDRTLFADSIATMVASSVGGPPCTTYSEVTGAVALTRAFNPAILTWAAITAICLSFVGKLGAILSTIPAPVMGGIMILLFGTITVVGLNTLVRAGQDLMIPRNMTIVAVILVFGIGGMAFTVGTFKLAGIGLAGITGVLLNLILPGKVAVQTKE